MIAGQRGSGKTTAARCLRAVGYKVVGAGDVVRRLCMAASLPTCRASLEEFGLTFIEKRGADAFAELLLQQAGSSSKVVIEGIRPAAVVRHIRERCQTTVVVYLEVRPQLRWLRLAQRGEEIEPKQDDSPLERQVLEIKELADVVLRNESSIAYLCEQVKEAAREQLES